MSDAPGGVAPEPESFPEEPSAPARAPGPAESRPGELLPTESSSAPPRPDPPRPDPSRPTPPPPAGPTDPHSRSGLRRASALLASGTLVSRILGFVKAIVLAATIGQVASEAGNAFGIANQLPNNIYALIAGGVLGAILVPQIVRAGSQQDGGQAFINKVVTIGSIAFIAITIVATIAAPLLVGLYAQSANGSGRGFSPEGVALATAFAYWCLPQVLFYAMYSLLGEVLNARRAFGAFTWAPVINNVVAIAGLLVFLALFGGAEANSEPAVWDSGRIALLAGSATLGVAAQAGILAVFWRRTGLSFRPDFAWRGVGLRRTGRAAGWTFGMIAVTQLAGIAQSRVASAAAGDGASVLALQNSWLIFMLPHSIIAVSIATAYFTRMSGHASTGDFGAVRRDVSTSLGVIGALITLASAALIVVAFPFARVFEVSFENVTAMALVIIAFSIALVPFSAVFVLQRAFYALEDTRTPFFVEAAKAGVFVVGAFSCTLLPVQWIGVGIALVTGIACTVQFALTFTLLRARLGGIGGAKLLRQHTVYAIAALVAMIVGVGIVNSLGALQPGGFAQQDRLAAILTIVVTGAGMAIVYLATLLAMRNPDATALVGAAAKRLRR